MMNRKMSKMLTRTGASKADKRFFKQLPHDIRGMMRAMYKNNTKLATPSFQTLVSRITAQVA